MTDSSANQLIPNPASALCAVSGDEDAPLTLRAYPENRRNYRAPFQRDRGRIIRARAFRRLAGKTQVFTHRYSDHFRSRLTHTIEVAQIARTVATALGLNQDLTEALALVHDIGHPPFGHAGERALDAAMISHGLRFDHNLHALRIVEHFEQRYAAFPGLNLTLAVREGIIKHSRDYRSADHPQLAEYFLDQRPPLEAQLIDLADEIAYLTADLDDGLEADTLKIDEMRAHLPLFATCFEQMTKRHPHAAANLLQHGALTRMTSTLTRDLIASINSQVEESGVQSLAEVRAYPQRLASFSPEMELERQRTKRYLNSHLYSSDELQHEHEIAAAVVGSLFHRWVAKPELLPAGHASRVPTDGAPRVVADYIAGMTDNFILDLWKA